MYRRRPPVHGRAGRAADGESDHELQLLGGVPQCAPLDADFATWAAAGTNAKTAPGTLTSITASYVTYVGNTPTTHYVTHRGVNTTFEIANDSAFASKFIADVKSCFGSNTVYALGSFMSFVSYSGSIANIDPDVAQLAAGLGGQGSGAAATNEDSTSVTAYNVPLSSPINNATIANAVRAAAALTIPHTIPCANTPVATGQWVYGMVSLYGGSSTNWVYCACPSVGCSGAAE